MARITLRRRRVLMGSTLFLLSANLVVGQDQAGRYDILRGCNNESSCQLKDSIHFTCNSSIAAPSLNVTPTASLCTCNKVFFNIWSACSYASGNNTLPSFSLWTTTCTNLSVDLAQSATLTTSKRGLGIDIPVWAFPDVPGNTTFDFQRAVVLVLASKPWSTMQIVVPIITAILGVALALLLTFIYRRNNLDQVQWREEFAHRLWPPQKLQSVDQRLLGAGWEIEPQEFEHREGGTSTSTKVDEPFVSPLTPPVETAPAGRPSRYTDSVDRSGNEPVAGPSGVGRGYPFGPSHQTQAPNPRPTVLAPVRQPQASDLELDTNRGWRFPKINVAPPWQRGPRRLVEVQPTRRFRVDPSSSGPGDESTRDSYPRTFFGTENHIGENDALEYELLSRDGDADIGLEDEGTNLISREEREERRRSAGVATMTSRVARSIGVDTMNTDSINSNVNIISPTVSPSTPRGSQMIGTSYTQPNPINSVVPLSIPPPPTQPAPAAPNNIFKRLEPRRRDNNTETSINSPPSAPPDQFRMTPIQEDRSAVGVGIRRRRSPTPTRSNLNNQQASSVVSQRVLDRPASNEPQRLSPSPAAPSSSALGQPPPYYLGASPFPPLRDQLANEAPIARSRSPLGEYEHPSRPSPFENLSPPVYPHAHQRSASASASAVSVNHDDIYGDPLTPPATHRKGVSGDATASFYSTPEPLTSATSTTSSRPQVGRDAGTLFPPSVRGAGYRGAPNG